MQRMIDEDYNVVVSGMSIAAMSCAYEALKAGKKVLIISNRGHEFTRGQRVVLHAGSRKYLKDMLTGECTSTHDIKFSEKLDKDVSVSIKNIERYLYRRLVRDFGNSRQLTMKFNSSLTAVDLSEGSATYQSDGSSKETRVEFTYLIGADGARRHAHSKVYEKLPRHYRSEIALVADINPTNHFFAEAIIKSNNGDALALPAEDLTFTTTPKFKGALYSKHARTIDEQTFVPVKIVASVPDDIAMIANEGERKTSLTIYANEVITALLASAGISHENVDIFILKQDINKASAAIDKSPTLFQIHVKKCNKATVSVNDHHFVIAGDAFRTSEYDYGHGANDALLHAQALGKHLTSRASLKDYDTVCQDQAAFVNIRKLFEKKSGSIYNDNLNKALDGLRESLGKKK